MTWIAAFVGSALTMLVLDGIWLSSVAKQIYRPQLGDMLMAGFRPVPAAVFYLTYVAGIVFLAVAPALDSGRFTVAVTRGLALGLVAYATYDLTNQATLRHWSTLVSVVDIGWGTLLTGAAASAGYLAARWTASF